jgi:hypothetical protein
LAEVYLRFRDVFGLHHQGLNSNGGMFLLIYS